MKFKWTKLEQDSFDEINQILDRDTLLTYPYFTEEIKIHTNASKFQLGAVIRKKSKPTAFYSRKLKDAHTSYTVTEKYVLIIVKL